jgi:hypothetical protein
MDSSSRGFIWRAYRGRPPASGQRSRCACSEKSEYVIEFYEEFVYRFLYMCECVMGTYISVQFVMVAMCELLNGRAFLHCDVYV